MDSSNSHKEQLEEKRRFWKQHIEDWQAGDINQTQYCREHHLAVHRFTYWKKKFQIPETSQSLIELTLPPALYPKMPSPASPLRVLISRFQVSVDRDFDPLTLRQLIYTLEHL